MQLKAHCRDRRRMPRRGFTLIEMLVSITIVATLASIVLVVASKARGRAKLATKINNLRQISIAHQAYMGDHHGELLPVQDKTRGQDGQNWRVMLSPYVLKDDAKTSEANRVGIFIDPLFTGYDPETPHLSGFAMNLRPGLPDDNRQNVHWNNEPADWERIFRAANIKRMDRTIFLADSANAWFFKDDNFSSRFDPSRHDGLGMVLMYDGSVLKLSPKQAESAAKDPSMPISSTET